jgi:tRNA dimethylallyltransferase
LWAHLAGECSLDEAVLRAVAASRQLAKRQLTWINADPGWQRLDPLVAGACERWVDEVCFVCAPPRTGTPAVVNWSDGG